MRVVAAARTGLSRGLLGLWVGLLLAPAGAFAAGSPLAAAFDRHARAVESAARVPDVGLTRWLGLCDWREWIDADRFEAVAGRVARAAGTAPVGPVIGLVRSQAAAEREAVDEALALAAVDGWWAEGTLDCGESDLAVRVTLPPWSQPVPLDRLAGLAQGATCRFRVAFELGEADRVTVGFDGPMGSQVRADGERLLVREARGRLLPDGELTQLDLSAGRHVLEIQFADGGAAGLEPFYLRLRPVKAPLRPAWRSDRPWLTDEPAAATSVPARPPRGIVRLEGARARLERVAAGPGGDACDAALLLDQAPDNPFCGNLILRRDDSRALTRRHDEPAALFFFALLLDRTGQGVAAAEILRFALRSHADFVEARASYLGLLVERGAARAAVDEVQRLLAPGLSFGRWTCQGVLRILSLGSQAGRGRAWLEGRLARRLDPELALALLERLEDENDGRAVQALARRLRRVAPWLVQADLAEARALVRERGDADVGPLLAAARRLGGSTSLDVAVILRAAGRDAEALQLVDAALEQNPSSERARLLALALGRVENGLDGTFGPLDAQALRARWLQQQAAGAKGLIGLEERQRRVVVSDGTSRTWTRVVLARLDGPLTGTPAYTLQVHAGSETLALPRLRIVKRAGGVVDLPEDRVETSSASPDGMVDETEEVSVPLGDLEPGDVFVIEALRVSRGLPGQRERPADLVFFRRDYPVLDARAEIVVPRRWVLKTGLFSKHDRLKGTVRDDRDARTWEVVGRDLPAWEGGDDDYAAWSTYASWIELGYDYGGRFARALTGRDEVAELARRVVAGLSHTGDRVAALHRWVSDNIRYFGVELGEHAYVPYPVETVLHRGYGDCKDKSALLASLLAEIGVHAVPVLVAGTDGVQLDPDLPMLDVFNHLLLYLPEDGRYLDPTLSGTPPGFLPAHVAGRAALAIDGSTAPHRLPEQDPADNLFREDVAWSAAGDGRFHVEAVLTLTGELAFPFREWLNDPAARAEGLADLLRALFPSLEVEQAEARVDVSGRVPALSVTLGGVDAMLCTQAGPGTSTGRRCSGFARDPHMLRETLDAWGQGFPYTYQGTFRLPSLPTEQVATLPPFRRVATSRAQLRVETQLEGRIVALHVGYRQERRHLPAKEAEVLRTAWVGQPTDVAWERGGR